MPTSHELIDFASERYDPLIEQQNIAAAKRQGQEVIVNDAHTLTFDLDSDEALTTFKSRYPILTLKGFGPSCVITKSKTSGHYHAVVTLSAGIRNLDERCRLIIQACLGSDWRREFIGMLCHINEYDRVSKVFQPQPAQVVDRF